MDEVTPVSLSEHIYAGVVYLTAFWSGTVFLSVLTSHMTQLYILGNQQSQQLNIMRRYLAQHGISKGLVLRVTRNAQHAMKMRQRATPEAAVGLMDLVSEPLRMELHYEMYFPLLGGHPFFSDYMKHCPYVVRKICHAAMSTSAYSRDDVIFHFGEAARRMLINMRGCLLYCWGAENKTTVEEGKWISEASLWTHWAHRGALTALEDSVVFHLNAESFQAIVSNFEIAAFDPIHYAAAFVESMNSAPDEITDLPFKVLGQWGSAQSRMRFTSRTLSARRDLQRKASSSRRNTQGSINGVSDAADDKFEAVAKAGLQDELSAKQSPVARTLSRKESEEHAIDDNEVRSVPGHVPQPGVQGWQVGYSQAQSRPTRRRLKVEDVCEEEEV